MEPAEEFKYMKKTEELPEGYVYAPWIMKTTASSINNVKVWDHRWWVNVFCKINWFFHFRMRKRFNKYKSTKIGQLPTTKAVGFLA